MTSIIKQKNKKYLKKTLIIFIWLILWQLASNLIGQKLLLVSPVEVLVNLFKLTAGIDFWLTIGRTFLRITTGLILATILGILIASLSSASKLFRAFIDPLFSVIKSIPVVSFVILVLIWVGSSYLSTIISFLMVLPIIYTNVLEGIINVDTKLLEMSKVYRMTFMKKIYSIYIPEVVPYFIAASKIAFGLCWKAGVSAEVIGLSDGTIGERLYTAKIFLLTGDVFTWTLVILILSTVSEKVFVNAIVKLEKWILSLGDK